MNGLSVAREVLLWSGSGDQSRAEIEGEYRALIHESYLKAHSRLLGDDPYKAGGGSADPSELEKEAVLLAPRTVRRLLWPRNGELHSTRKFIRDAFLTERAVRTSGEPDGYSGGWTADGRAFLSVRGVSRSQFLLGNSIVLDMLSPHARRIDLLGDVDSLQQHRPEMSSEERGIVQAKVAQAWEGICSTGGELESCIKSWSRVIVAQSEGSGRFWSGSNGQYIGRVVLANVSEHTPIEDVADAIVHESIHGFLYMHESVVPWVRRFDFYASQEAIVSPWSGNPLPVRAYLQACWVWYGLAAFWAHHVHGHHFAPDRSCFLLNRALMGFRSGSLADLVRPWNRHLQEDMVDLISELQAVILRLLS